MTGIPYWLTDGDIEHPEPLFPERHGTPHIEDHRDLSGAIFLNRNGLRWCDAPKECGLAKARDNRWKR